MSIGKYEQNVGHSGFLFLGNVGQIRPIYYIAYALNLCAKQREDREKKERGTVQIFGQISRVILRKISRFLEKTGFWYTNAKRSENGRVKMWLR